MESGDKDMARNVRKELARHTLDIAEVQVSCIGGRVTLTGRIKPLGGRSGDFDASLASAEKALRANRLIREVVFDWTSPLESAKDKSAKEAAIRR